MPQPSWKSVKHSLRERAPKTLNNVLTVLNKMLNLAVGTTGFAAHFTEWLTSPSAEAWQVELTEAPAAVAGAFLLRGRDWARWLALAWIAVNVVLSAFHVFELAVYLAFAAAIGWGLLRPPARRYFCPADIEPPVGT
jgi:hypothetical protein